MKRGKWDFPVSNGANFACRATFDLFSMGYAVPRPRKQTEKAVPGFTDGFGDRLETVIKRIGGMEASATVAGGSVDQLSSWKLGRTRPDFFALARLCEAAGRPVGWLANGEDDQQIKMQIGSETQAIQKITDAQSDASNYVPDGFVAVPQLDIRASAGLGRASLPAEAVATSHFLFREQWLRSLGIAPQNAEFVLAEGDSMEPTIRDGDMMLLDRGYGRVINGKIYVLVVNDLVMVKRVHVLAGAGLMLIPDNDRYPSETIAHNDVRHLQIEARVAWFGRTI